MAKIIAAIHAVVQTYKVTLDQLKDQAVALQSEVTDIAVKLDNLQNNMLIPFLADVTMAVRTKVIETDARTFFLMCGFPSTQGMDKVDKKTVPMSLETVLGYHSKMNKWIDAGTPKDKLPTSMTALVAGASQVASQVTETGRPNAKFLKAARGPSGKFRQQISDEIFKPKSAQADNRTGTGKPDVVEPKEDPKPKDTGGRNSDSEGSESKVASDLQVFGWINAQADQDQLLKARHLIASRLNILRKEGKKAQA
jgi:hypothetical protein